MRRATDRPSPGPASGAGLAVRIMRSHLVVLHLVGEGACHEDHLVAGEHERLDKIMVVLLKRFQTSLDTLK